MNVRFDPLLHFGNDRTHVAAMNENSNRHNASAVLAADVHAATENGKRSELSQRDVQTGRSIDEHIFEV